jgi:type II secretory pathway component GspD/PulD (secretin)
MKMIWPAIAVTLACLAWRAAAQPALEVISLKHRTAEQVLPVLRPLLEPGGTLTGQYSQLIVRASPRNLAEIRRVLEAIDRPPRRLQIWVRFDDALDASRENFGASGQIGNRGASVDLRAQDSRRGVRDKMEQRIQVLEGGRAYISTGQSRPLPQRQIIQTPGGVVAQETLVIQELATGFEVVPRLAGDSVFLDIAPQRETPGAVPGSAQAQRVAATVRTRLGEWVDIGGSSANAARETGGIGSMSRSSALESRRVWLMVEEIAN